MATAVTDAAGEKTGSAGSREWVKLAISGGIAAAIVSGVLAISAAVVAPEIGRGWQDHDRRIAVRTALATEMSRSFTLAIGAGQRIALGLIYAPTGDPDANAAVVQGEYNRGLGQWRVDSGRLRAELEARYPDDPIVSAWRDYTVAVTGFYRLGAGITPDDRSHLVRSLQDYLGRMSEAEASVQQSPPIPWDALTRVRHFHKRPDFQRAYNRVSDVLQTLGDAYVQDELGLKPAV